MSTIHFVFPRCFFLVQLCAIWALFCFFFHSSSIFSIVFLYLSFSLYVHLFTFDNFFVAIKNSIQHVLLKCDSFVSLYSIGCTLPLVKGWCCLFVVHFKPQHHEHNWVSDIIRFVQLVLFIIISNDVCLLFCNWMIMIGNQCFFLHFSTCFRASRNHYYCMFVVT